MLLAPFGGTPQDALRAFGRAIASSVFVVTAAGQDGVAHGATISASTSLSLDPPRILICLDLSSRTLAALRDTGFFRVHILGAEQSETSRAFAGKDREAYCAHLRGSDANGAPMLREAIAAASCEVAETFAVGDHVIVVGAPSGVVTAASASPLIYHRGGYAALAAA